MTIRNFCEEQDVYGFTSLLHIATAAILMLEQCALLAACRANVSVQVPENTVREERWQSDTSIP